MRYSISPVTGEDREAVIDILNYYIENSFAAYPESKLPYDAFDRFMKMSEGYPNGAIRDQSGKMVGFGMLRNHNPLSTFSHTAEITCFLAPAYTGTGLGKILLEFLEKQGREVGITIILAHISSFNTGSINFHRQNGFSECGRFIEVGKKNGRKFDVIWMQKMLK